MDVNRLTHLIFIVFWMDGCTLQAQSQFHWYVGWLFIVISLQAWDLA